MKYLRLASIARGHRFQELHKASRRKFYPPGYQEEKKMMLTTSAKKVVSRLLQPRCRLRPLTTTTTTVGRQAVGGAVFGGLVLGTFGLGVWQTKRFFWKTDVIEDRKRALEVDAQRRSVEDAREQPTYERSILRGSFVASKQVLVGPRSPPPGLVEKAQGMGRGPIGYEVVTKFVDETGAECLVNRGWVPTGREPTCPEGQLDLVVVPDKGEPQKTFSPPNTTRNVLWVELGFIADVLGLSKKDNDVPYFIALADGQTGDDWPKPRSPVQCLAVNIDPPTHAAYAITWFSLSLFGAFMTRRILYPPVPRRLRIQQLRDSSSS